eukprot:TRINITY_DN5113_c0_g1_i1.p1 TRINITY_DN5113_c0_g1~~TRINITY_DN5113_c0_g1_i1.p1  ORF type:complete len:388 (+),score=156.34 TRINITY_DN5113_c0_g1_i1:42-1205(+)
MRGLVSIGGGVVAAGAAFSLLPKSQKWEVHSAVADLGTTLLRKLDAETAHHAAILAASWKLTPVAPATDPVLFTNCLGLGFESPIGLAAGFDKNAEAIEGLLDLGFGFVEIGTVTPLAQAGNERPRMFRLEEDRGVINRYGFNNDGMDVVEPRVRAAQKHGKPLGINVGKNKVTPEAEAVSDYSKTIRKLGPHADYLVVNVSSPNTPGLRDLQKKEVLQTLLTTLVSVRGELAHNPPILVKIAPDLNPAELKDIADASLAAKVDGVIVNNTTISRPDTLQSENKTQAGGLSGRPLRELATQTISNMYTHLQGRVPIIGVGGIGSGKDAYEKIRAGASLVQIYSMLAYEGPSLAHRANVELAELLKDAGYTSVKDAVGAAHRESAGSA